jgi:DNA-binding MarR family transcriptional regulator
MSGYVDRLEKAGLVTRLRSEQDRRRVGLAVTEQGVKVLRSARSRRTAWLASRLRRLDDDELAAIEAALPALARLLEEDA